VPARAVTDILDVLPNAHLRIIRGAGHMSPLTHAATAVGGLIAEHVPARERPGPVAGAPPPIRSRRPPGVRRADEGAARLRPAVWNNRGHHPSVGRPGRVQVLPHRLPRGAPRGRDDQERRYALTVLETFRRPAGDRSAGDTQAAVQLAAFPYRVFGIGMNKTGTTSLGQALRRLGVVPVATQKLVHAAGLIEALIEREDYEPALRYARMYRAFEDRPWNMWDMYRRLDERYPGSRFVLTVRDPESWWLSVGRWIKVSKPWAAERYRRHLRAESLAEAHMVESYERFNREIGDYFRGRDDLAVLDFEAGEGWEPLCALLDLPVPDRRFPHTNRQSYDRRDRSRNRRGGAPKRLLGRPGAQAPVGVELCVRCATGLPPAREETRGLVSRLPSWTKEAYRSLQRRAFVPAAGRHDAARRAARLRRDHPGLRTDDLAVVTCFFNPCGYRSRVENYRRFRQALEACGLPVLTVELAVGSDPFCLGPEAGEVLRRRAAAPIWQKERLLNLGIRQLLARGYRKIVWLDADVTFEDLANWPWHVAAALERFAVCQVFGQVLVEQDGGRTLLPGVSGVRYHHELGIWLDQQRRGPSPRRPVGYPLGYSGFGWAARAEVLRQIELYDRAVVGGGDKLILAASCGLDERWRRRAKRLLRTTLRRCPSCGHANSAPRYLADYFDWARRWDRIVGGRCGWADRTLRALYHGDRMDRRYSLRRDILLRHDFDPSQDLELDASGCWRWSSAKPQLHLEVQNYFFERREDS